MFEKLSNKELEERIKIMEEQMVTGGLKNNSDVAYGAAILYRMLTGEKEEREMKKLKSEGKEPYRSIFG